MRESVEVLATFKKGWAKRTAKQPPEFGVKQPPEFGVKNSPEFEAKHIFYICKNNINIKRF
jgi:hypothetical protein